MTLRGNQETEISTAADIAISTTLIALGTPASVLVACCELCVRCLLSRLAQPAVFHAALTRAALTSCVALPLRCAHTVLGLLSMFVYHALMFIKSTVNKHLRLAQVRSCSSIKFAYCWMPVRASWFPHRSPLVVVSFCSAHVITQERRDKEETLSDVQFADETSVELQAMRTVAPSIHAFENEPAPDGSTAAGAGAAGAAGAAGGPAAAAATGKQPQGPAADAADCK